MKVKKLEVLDRSNLLVVKLFGQLTIFVVFINTDRSVRGWDLTVGREAWRGWCGGSVGALAAGDGGGARVVLAAAGAAVRLFDTRARTPLTTLW